MGGASVVWGAGISHMGTSLQAGRPPRVVLGRAACAAVTCQPTACACPPSRRAQVTPLERVALQFLFDALDAGTAAGVAAAAAAARQSLAGLGAACLVGGGSWGSKKHKKGAGAAGGGSKGFGGAAPKGFGGKA
mgnify:CR=1 FL=1